jgi:hypothetical protein
LAVGSGENILRLDIAVNQIRRVQIVHYSEQLGNVVLDMVIGQILVRTEYRSQIAVDIFKHQKQVDCVVVYTSIELLGSVTFGNVVTDV